MNKIKYANLSIETMKAELYADKPDGFIAGWATTSSVDVYKDIVAEGAFSESIADRGLTGPRGIKFLIDHIASVRTVAGVFEKLEYRLKDGKQALWLEAQLDLTNAEVVKAYNAAKVNGGLSFSVGFRTKTWTYDEDKNILTIMTGDLREVSLVVFPANEDCEVVVIKSDDGHVPASRVAQRTASVTEEMGMVAAFERALISKRIVSGRNGAKRVREGIDLILTKFDLDDSAQATEFAEAITRARIVDKLEKAGRLVEVIKVFDDLFKAAREADDADAREAKPAPLVSEVPSLHEVSSKMDGLISLMKRVA